MLVQVLDRLLLLALLYFIYMLIFHLPPSPHCDPSPTPSPLPETLSTYPSSNDDHTICPHNAEADKIMKDFLEIQNSNLDRIKRDGKFIIFSATDSAGFGNRIPALMSSFILALILERGFLVHWPEVSQQNIKDQFDESSVVMAGFSDLFVPPVPIDILAIPSYYSFIDDATAVAIKLDESADLLLCDDLESTFQDRQFVVVRGYRPFFDLLFHNTRIAARAHALGLTRMVHALASCLLRPVPRVFDLVRQFKVENAITNKHQLIMTRKDIRKRSQHGLTEREQDGLWSCIRKRYPPPDLWKYEEWGEVSEKEVKEEEERSKEGTGVSRFNNATHLYFLASDSDGTLDLVPPDFLPYVVRLSGGIARNTTSGIIRALADIWILGHSVELFGAQGTTFLSAVRTLFPSKTNLAVLGGNKVDKYCRAVGDLPCFKWWDLFQSRDVPGFNLSCFSPNPTAKELVVC